MEMFNFIRKHKLSSISFDDWPDDLMEDYLKRINGFFAVRRLEDRSVVGVMELATTISVCSGIDPLTPFQYRWCFREPKEAVSFYKSISEFDEIPLPENRKSLVGHRYTNNPLIVEYDQLGFPKW